MGRVPNWMDFGAWGSLWFWGDCGGVAEAEMGGAEDGAEAGGPEGAHQCAHCGAELEILGWLFCFGGVRCWRCRWPWRWVHGPCSFFR